MKLSKQDWFISATLYFCFPTTGYCAETAKAFLKIVPKYLLSIFLIVGLSSCASMEKSILLGGAAGAATGTGVGLAAFGSTKGTLISAGSGMLLGGLVGMLLHKNKQVVVTDPTGARKDGQMPSLTSPDVRRMWIEPSIEGSRYIDGHWIYLIERPSVWSK